jgi:hypothetical protein
MLTENNSSQIQDPYVVLEDFFSCFDLYYIRKVLWDWLVVALSSESGTFNSGYSRSNLIYFYERVELLIEAANEIHKRNKDKKELLRPAISVK